VNPFERVAIQPANVLLPDPAAEWMRLAVALVLEQDLGSSASAAYSLVAGQSAAYQMQSTRVLLTTVEMRAGELSISSMLGNPGTLSNPRNVSTEAAPTELIPALDQLARQLDPRATPFSTRNQRALELFAAGFFSADVQLKLSRLHEAIGADPAFGLAYIALADLQAAAKSPELANTLQLAALHRSSFTQLDKARFDLLQARYGQAPLAVQTSAASALATLLPNNGEALASLGSYFFLSGKVEDGEHALNRALQTNPANPRFRQQLAVGLLESRKYSAAAQVFESLAQNPGNNAVLPQLASCLLLSGNAAGANDVFAKFLRPILNPDARLLLEASWQALTGRRSQALQALSNHRFADARVSNLAKSQMVLWQLLDKHTEAARQIAAGADPLVGVLANGAPSAAEWHSRVEALPAGTANQEMKDLLLRYGYFLHGFYPQAAQAWEEADKAAGGTDLRIRAMLAASLRAARREADANKIAVQPFVPDLSDFYNAVSFAQLRLLLGQAG